MAFGKGKKRAASSAAGSAKKKPAGNSAMCNVVAAELAKASSLSSSCRSMLSNMCKDSLTTYEADRHAYQKRSVAMIGETLAGIQAKLEEDIASAQALVDSADKEKASRVNVEAAAKETLASLEAAATNAKATVDADTAAEKAAKATLAAAIDAMASKDNELANLQGMQSRLKSAKEGTWDKQYEVPQRESKRTANALTKCLADAGLEDGLVESLEATLTKEVGDRGTFGTVVFKEVTEFMQDKFAELEKSITAWQPAKDALVKEKESAEAAHVSSMDKLKSSLTALSEAEASKKEGKKAHSTCAFAVASYESDMAKAGKALEKANTALVAFQEGPKKFFEALQHLAPPPEPEPVVEEAATTDAYGATEAIA